jgi:hypothetical protein
MQQCSTFARVQLGFMAQMYTHTDAKRDRQMRTELMKAVLCNAVARVLLGSLAQMITGVNEAVQYIC